MDAISNFFGWLFGTREGVLALVVGGIVFFLIVAIVLERRTRQKFKEHEKQEGDWDLFGSDDESGWSDFEEDNH